MAGELTRRHLLEALTVGSAAALVGCGASGPRALEPRSRGETTMTFPTALAADHQLLPLPFAAGSLTGISERMIASHHENNYGGAVRNLNRTEQELAQTTRETPPLLVAALRERELTFRNSKALHELYFGNLGGDGRRPAVIDAALSQAYGSAERWEEHFRATGTGLGGGSGWVMLSLELDTGALRTTWSGHHTQSLATGVPLLVMDMYEHSYQMDFGAAVPRYLDAFFANVQWDEVHRRLERAQRLRAVMTG